MPLDQLGMASFGSDIENQHLEQIREVFSIFDRQVDELSKANGLLPAQVKLLQPLHKCVIVGDVDIFVILSVTELGVVYTYKYIDWSDKPTNMETAIFVVQRDLGFKDAFGFQFSRRVLDLDAAHKEVAVAQIAKRYIEDEMAHVERQKRLIRL